MYVEFLGEENKTMNHLKKINKKFAFFYLLTFIIIFLISANSNAEIITVDQSGSGDYTTIKHAISQAKNDDIINVKPGIYTENLVIDKKITLIGEDADNTIIDGGNKTDVIKINSDNVRIDSFKIINSGKNIYPDRDAGLDIRSNNNTVEKLIIVDNNCYGIFMLSCNNTKILNCNIKDNEYRGINIDSGGSYNISFNTVSNHSHNIYIDDIKDSDIFSNTLSKASQNGLYLGSGSSNNTINSNVFTNNDQGCHIKSSTKNIIINNLYINNIRGIFFCCGAEDNIVYQNYFMDNNEHVYGYPVNIFDNGVIGNFWDDYKGSDDDSDGIGDTSYIVSKLLGSDNIDRFPIVNEDINSDIDDDGLNNSLEIKIGSNIDKKNSYQTFTLESQVFYLVDTNYNETFDILYNSDNDSFGRIKKQDDDYLIDYNNDYEWDYLFKKDESLVDYKMDNNIPGFGLILILLSLFFVFFCYRYKEK